MNRDSGPLQKLPEDLMPGDVRDYLQNNPQFLADNADLLPLLTPPTARRNADGVQDFQHFMLSRLQQHINSIRGENDNLMDLLQEHLQRQNRINAAVLALYDSASFEETISVITEQFKPMLDQEAVALFIEAGPTFPHGMYGGAEVVPLGFVDTWLGSDRDILLEETSDKGDSLFGTTASSVGSQALVRLNFAEGVPSGLLALGHGDPMYYATGLATEQIEFLGAIIERCVRKWLR